MTGLRLSLQQSLDILINILKDAESGKNKEDLGSQISDIKKFVFDREKYLRDRTSAGITVPICCTETIIRRGKLLHKCDFIEKPLQIKKFAKECIKCTKYIEAKILPEIHNKIKELENAKNS